MSQVVAQGSTRHQAVPQHIANCMPAADVHGKAQAAQQPLFKASKYAAWNIPEGRHMRTTYNQYA